MTKIILSIQILTIAAVGFLFYKIYFLDQASVNPTGTPAPIVAVDNAEPSPEPFDAKSYIDSLFASYELPTPLPAATPIASTQTTTTTTQKQTSFITMGATSTTTSTDWIDVPGSEVYIDLANDYSKSAYVTFSATLKVAHGNGQAFARVYDATNNIAVSGSELSTTNNMDEKQVTSGSLNLWSGNNLYKIQIKSLNSFEVTYVSGRLKISY